MKAMILAAGLGTRLRPLTLDRPKPAMPLAGKPIIVRVVERLRSAGIKGCRINLHHLPDVIEEIFSRHRPEGMELSFSREDPILGTAGGLKANEAFFDEDTFLMVNGKIVFDFSLEPVIDFHRSHGGLATLVLVPQTAPYRFSPVRIDREYRLRDFKGACPGGDQRPEIYAFTGIHVLNRAVFDFIPPGGFYEINDRVYPDAMAAGLGVYGFPVQGAWFDPSNAIRYREALRYVLETTAGYGGRYVDPSATVHPDAHLGHWVSLEAGCRIDSGAMVDDSVFWEDVTAEASATVRNCVVGSGVTLRGFQENLVITRFGTAALEQG